MSTTDPTSAAWRDFGPLKKQLQDHEVVCRDKQDWASKEICRLALDAIDDLTTQRHLLQRKIERLEGEKQQMHGSVSRWHDALARIRAELQDLVEDHPQHNGLVLAVRADSLDALADIAAAALDEANGAVPAEPVRPTVGGETASRPGPVDKPAPASDPVAEEGATPPPGSQPHAYEPNPSTAWEECGICSGPFDDPIHTDAPMAKAVESLGGVLQDRAEQAQAMAEGMSVADALMIMSLADSEMVEAVLQHYPERRAPALQDTQTYADLKAERDRLREERDRLRASLDDIGAALRAGQKPDTSPLVARWDERADG